MRSKLENMLKEILKEKEPTPAEKKMRAALDDVRKMLDVHDLRMVGVVISKTSKDDDGDFLSGKIIHNSSEQIVGAVGAYLLTSTHSAVGVEMITHAVKESIDPDPSEEKCRSCGGVH